VQNGHILEDLDLVGSVLHNKVLAIPAMGDARLNGLQEVDGPPN
jgi:hypothetical protein